MKLPSALVLVSLFALACDLSKLKSEEPVEEGSEEVASGDRWWEDDAADSNSGTDTDEGGGAPGGTGDTGSDSEEDPMEDSFEIELNLETGEGSFGVDFTDCRIRGEIVDGTEATPCADCSLARSMKIGSLSIEEAAGCGEFMNSGSDTMTYGHGTEELFEFDGISMHTLFEQVDGEWSTVADGYSIVIDTSWIIVIDLAG